MELGWVCAVGGAEEREGKELRLRERLREREVVKMNKYVGGIEVA